MSTQTYLFYIGIIVPTTITVILFGTFLYCMYRYKARRKVLTQVYAPHSKGWPNVKVRTPPCSTTYYKAPLIYDTKSLTGDTDPGREYTQQFDFASRHQDSGIADMGDQAMDEVNVKKTSQRPYSQASTDSDDSGFRSARSAINNTIISKQNGSTKACNGFLHTIQTAYIPPRLGQRLSHEKYRERFKHTTHIDKSQTTIPACTVLNQSSLTDGKNDSKIRESPLLQGFNECHRQQSRNILACNTFEYFSPASSTQLNPFTDTVFSHTGAHLDTPQSYTVFNPHSIPLYNMPSTLTSSANCGVTTANIHSRGEVNSAVSLPVFSVV